MYDKLSEACKEVFKERLKSVFLSGTAGTEDMIDGWSDNDVVIVLDKVESKDYNRLSEIGKRLSLGDTFLLTPIPAEDFKNPSLWTLMNKHKCMILYGNEFIRNLPDIHRERAIKELHDFTERIRRKFTNRSASSMFWSDKYAKEKLYKFFKRTITLYEINEFLETGKYPKTRSELLGKSTELDNIINLLKIWPTVSAEQIKQTYKEIEIVLGRIKEKYDKNKSFTLQ